MGGQKPRIPSFNAVGSELSRAGPNKEYENLQTSDSTGKRCLKKCWEVFSSCFWECVAAAGDRVTLFQSW